MVRLAAGSATSINFRDRGGQETKGPGGLGGRDDLAELSLDHLGGA
jgi:hypothetical protein